MTAFAQGGGTSVTVGDSDGRVRRRHPGRDRRRQEQRHRHEVHAVTNESGTFTVPAVDPGTYTVTVTLMGFKTAVLNDVRVNAGDAGVGQGRARSRRPGRNRRRHRRLGDHPDAVGGGLDDHRHEPDPEAADRQPQRARLRHHAARREHAGRRAATRRSTACRRARSTSRSTASARRTTT